MKLSTQVRPISEVKANAAELIRELRGSHQALVITQNGKASAVLQDIASWEATQEALALLKILALGQRQLEEGAVSPAATVFGRLRRRLSRR